MRGQGRVRISAERKRLHLTLGGHSIAEVDEHHPNIFGDSHAGLKFLTMKNSSFSREQEPQYISSRFCRFASFYISSRSAVFIIKNNGINFRVFWINFGKISAEGASNLVEHFAEFMIISHSSKQRYTRKK
jgi:hypothetical protein